MDARRVGLVLLLASLGALALLHEGRTFPADFEQWACCGREGDFVMVARGPAAARYDAATDTTFAVFQCAHGYCGFAVRLEGDERGAVARESVLVRSVYVPPGRDEQPMAEPIVVDEMGRDRAILNATGETFSLAPRWPSIVALDAVATLGVAGVLLAWGMPRRRAAAGAGGAVAGALLAAWFLGALSPDVSFLARFVPWLLAAIAAPLALLGRSRPWAAGGAATLAGMAAGLALALALTDGFYVHPPLM